MDDVERRIRAKLWPNERGCWVFIGTNNGGNGRLGGYGRLHVGVRVNGKQTKRFVHRLMYERHIGPIPAGVLVLHRCDNRRCCNPAHLWLGDHAANCADKITKGRARNGWTGPLKQVA